MQNKLPPTPGGKPGKIGLKTGTKLLTGDSAVSIRSVEGNKFADCGIHCKGSTDPAQVMPGIAMTVSNGKCDTRLCAG
jgi:hypothetical protein